MLEAHKLHRMVMGGLESVAVCACGKRFTGRYLMGDGPRYASIMLWADHYAEEVQRVYAVERIETYSDLGTAFIASCSSPVAGSVQERCYECNQPISQDINGAWWHRAVRGSCPYQGEKVRPALTVPIHVTPTR